MDAVLLLISCRAEKLRVASTGHWTGRRAAAARHTHTHSHEAGTLSCIRGQNTSHTGKNFGEKLAKTNQISHKMTKFDKMHRKTVSSFALL